MEGDITEEQQSRHRPPELGSSPWLIYAHGEDLHNQVFYNLSERRYHVRRIAEMQQKEILTSLYGWLLLLDVRTRDLTLLNPSSMQKIQLPPFINSLHKHFCFLLSRPPDDPNSIVMCLKKDKAQIVMFCKPGDLEWTSPPHLNFNGEGDGDDDEDDRNDDDAADDEDDEDDQNDDDEEEEEEEDDDDDEEEEEEDDNDDEEEEEEEEEDDDDDDDDEEEEEEEDDDDEEEEEEEDDGGGGFHFAVICKGEIYIQTKDDRLFAIKVEDYHVKLLDLKVKLPKPRRRLNFGYTKVLVGSSDDLFVILPYSIGRYGKQFEIFKLDLEKKEWSSVENLSGHAVFFNDHRGFIAPTSSESEGSVIRDNRIYITQPDDPYLYEYDIKENSVEISLPCPNLTKNFPEPIWFLP
ncbi:hypothetical protein Tsubulata_037708 [Turnera subulata]|uniref:KIB1-4 beta-propeller domain-containing protein n=1 Tax=Turnera subulata TaxID=218843 RepID=A0A9Q0FHT9_9ROSI|nr:hypothetical protein Tsubulata_037708 [Turnera subulata]